MKAKALLNREVLYMTARLTTRDEFVVSIKSIRKITEVHRKYFKIEGTPVRFDYHGRQLFKVSAMKQTSASQCFLIEEQDKAYIKDLWEERIRKRELKKHFQEEVNHLTKTLNRIEL